MTAQPAPSPPLKARAMEAAHAVILMPLVALLVWRPIPFGNEALYLLSPYRIARPDFLAGDWIFSQGAPEYLVFNLAAGLAMKLVSLEAVALIGRLICWMVILLGSIRIGTALGAGRIGVTIAILLWVALGQSLVGAEWVFYGLEAKVVSYCFAVFAIERALRGRPVPSGLLAGAAFLLHPAVGLQVGLGIAVGMLAVRTEWKALVRWGGAAALVGLPQVVILLLAAGQGTGTGPEEWRLIGSTLMPFHFDPLTFPKRDLLAFGIVSLFVLAAGLRQPWRREAVLSAGFLAGLLVFVAFGFGARLLGRYELLAITPFRTAPLFAPLFFLFLLAAMWRQGELGPDRPWLSGLALIGLLGLPTPLVGAVERARETLKGMPEEDPGLLAGMDWIALNTRPEIVTILPPWRKDSYFRTRRPQVASWEAVRYGDMREWRRRMEAMVGPLPLDRQVVWDDLKERYYALTEPEIRGLAGEFGARIILSRSGYELPVRFETQGFAVYDLGQ